MSWPTKKFGEILVTLFSAFFALNKKQNLENNKEPKKEPVLPVPKTKTAEELEGEQIMSLLMRSQTNPADSEATKRLRKFINYEFGLDFEKDHLQCTEYVHFKVLKELGTKIDWTGRVGPRHGVAWPDQFLTLKRYRVLDMPKKGYTMSFTAGCTVPPGHVAFVEEVLNDDSIVISEANWPPPGQKEQGQYNKRPLSKKDWKEKYRGRFVDFS